jgi:hypothetical protein
MEVSKAYTITLEKGEAPCKYFELTESERHQIGLRVLGHVTTLAKQVGASPVVTTIRAKRPRIKHSIY